MKAILIEDVNKIGKKGDMVEVKQGYFRNYLKRNNLAVEATKENTKIWEEKKEEARIKDNEDRKNAYELKEKLEKLKLKIKVKVGEDKKVFGSVTNKDIQKALKKESFDIDKKKIILDENVKQLGNFTCEVKLYPEISAHVDFSVEG